MCSECKQKEVGQVVAKQNLYVLASQESWERDGSVVSVDGYKWFHKPRNNQNIPRGEGGVGFLVRECLVDEDEFSSQVRYEESVCMKVCGGRGWEEFLYMPAIASL